MRKIFIYRNGNKNDVQCFFEKADEKLQGKFKSILSYISNEKNPLCEPYVKHISIVKYRELYEIRMKASGNMVRVLFVKQVEDIVLLYAFYKKSSKDTEKALEAARSKKNERLYLLMQTICSIGIRVSELRFITVAAVNTGVTNINCKGKLR